MLRTRCGIDRLLLHNLLLLLTLPLPALAAAQETRVVTGVVVDAGSDAPVADVLVAIQGTALATVTDADGRFELRDVPVGTVPIVLRHVAYGEHAQPVVVASVGPLDFQIRISSRAIVLSPMVVQVTSPEERARRASGNATHVIDRATIDAFPVRGQGLLPLLTGRIPSLRVVGSCVEYRLQVFLAPTQDPDSGTVSGYACRDVTVYVDGIPSREGSALLASLRPEDVERIQVLAPGEAGARYAGAGRGVILVETRSGVTPGIGDRRVKVTGFGWNEPQPYRLLRVLAASAVTDATLAGILTRAFADCRRDALDLTSVRCRPIVATVPALLTSAIGGIVTRRAGRTVRSEGRTLPSLLIGTATASIGFALYLHGVDEDSPGARAAGLSVLGVGMPLALTLSDRVLRVLR